MNAPAPQPKKSLFRSMTFYSAVLFVVGYFAAKQYNASPIVMEGIILIGIASMAIFMRRGLISMLDTPMPGETEALREKIAPKPLYRSMTVLSAILLVAGWGLSKYYFHINPDTDEATAQNVTQGIFVVGVAAIVVFLRRGILNALHVRG